MRTFTTIPSDTFEKMLHNVGVICMGADGFSTTTKAIKTTSILGATTGGISFTDAVSYKDLGDGIDNCPKNTKELKDIESREVKLSGTLKTIDTTVAKTLLGAADIASGDSTKVQARDVLKQADFNDVWWVTDYSDKDGGYIAINLKNVLSTGGLSIKSTDKETGEFSFEFVCHYSITSDEVPYCIYIEEGNDD